VAVSLAAKIPSSQVERRRPAANTTTSHVQGQLRVILKPVRRNNGVTAPSAPVIVSKDSVGSSDGDSDSVTSPTTTSPNTPSTPTLLGMYSLMWDLFTIVMQFKYFQHS